MEKHFLNDWALISLPAGTRLRENNFKGLRYLKQYDLSAILNFGERWTRTKNPCFLHLINSGKIGWQVYNTYIETQKGILFYVDLYMIWGFIYAHKNPK
jgi:hypothetical protein